MIRKDQKEVTKVSKLEDVSDIPMEDMKAYLAKGKTLHDMLRDDTFRKGFKL